MGRQLSLEVYYTYMTVMVLIMSRVTEMCLWRKKIHNTEKKSPCPWELMFCLAETN